MSKLLAPFRNDKETVNNTTKRLFPNLDFATVDEEEAAEIAGVVERFYVVTAAFQDLIRVNKIPYEIKQSALNLGKSIDSRSSFAGRKAVYKIVDACMEEISDILACSSNKKEE